MFCIWPENMQGSTTLVFIGLLAVAFGGLTGRIIGGSPALDGKYPYQIFILKHQNFVCGGSILNNRYILTAAHCVVYKRAQDVTVTVGTNNKTGSHGIKYQAEKLIPHKKYNPSTIVNDIALIRLTKDIEFNQKVQPIVLPSEDFKAFDTFAKLTGWGRLDDGSSPAILQEINLRVLDDDTCTAYWPAVTNSQICTVTSYSSGACYGDSGGPLVSAEGAQIGIVSFGRPCALGYPDVFTRVYYYLDWIAENTDDINI